MHKQLLIFATLLVGVTPGCARPSPSPTPVATATPTSMPTPSPTPDPTMSPTPELTPPPELRLESALAHQRNGNYEAAIAECEAILSGPATHEAPEAQFRLGENRLLNGEYQSAIEALQVFLQAHPQDERIPQAHFLLGRAYQGLGEWAQAIPHLREYLDERDVVAGYVNELMGDCYFNLEDYPRAIAAYEEALRQAPSVSREFQLVQKIAEAHLGMADYEEAISLYEAILGKAEKSNYRAEIEYLIGWAYQEWGRMEEAHEHFLEAVNRYPRAKHAYWALVELAEAGVEVDEFQRGLVDYYAGAYELAIRAFQRYINGGPTSRLDDARYYLALAHKGAGNHASAVRELDLLIETHPESGHWGRAWLEKAEILADSGKLEEAVRVCWTFTKLYPHHELAGEALWRAANLIEGDGRYDEAAWAYLDLRERYPWGEHAGEALFRAGLCRYRLGEYEEAAEAWRELLSAYARADSHPAVFWLGKALLKLGKAEEAHTSLEEAAAAGGYYALRAEILDLGDEGQKRMAASDEAAEREEAEAWLATWLDSPDGGLRSIEEAIEEDSRFERGRELLSLGLREEAMGEFEELRKDMADDPLALYQLSLSFRGLRLYRPSISCAARLIQLSPAGSVHEAPLFLQQLAYPVYFDDLVVEEAQANRLDPLLLFSLIRQESRFDGWATSTANAIGLTQIMPSTGEWIAYKLGFRGYRADYLHRPYLNVKFGAWYLARQLEDFEGDLFAALAAYNSGPNRARRWLEGTGGDDDLFVETIPMAEPRRYVKEVYEHYVMYRALYGGRRTTG